ncbi:MAG: TssQ family T6SS-associated lipoprotein [Panacagrimonas sp.]
MRRLAILALAALLPACAAIDQMVQATKAQVTLVEGLRQYDAGDHDESAKALAAALEQGLGEKDRAAAHKHLAFIHCSAGRERQCREEFRRALADDPATHLDPAEAGHPVWGPIFQSLKPAR